jgi:hypothetical protein
VLERQALLEREASLERQAVLEREITIEREARDRHASAAPAEPTFSASAADQNLAEMAQRLEAALRRAPKPPAEPRLAEPRVSEPAPLSAAVSPPTSVATEVPLAEPETTTAEQLRPSRLAARPLRADPSARIEPREAKAPMTKSLYDSLEQEMASLLRPDSKP